MKVVKHGKNYIRYGKCDCGCEFEYDRNDTQAYREICGRNGSILVSERVKIKSSKKEDIAFYVTCPECGNRVLVDREI